jgi:hypothetical protein
VNAEGVFFLDDPMLGIISPGGKVSSMPKGTLNYVIKIWIFLSPPVMTDTE